LPDEIDKNSERTSRKGSLSRRQFLQRSMAVGGTAVSGASAGEIGPMEAGASGEPSTAGSFVVQWKNQTPTMPWLSTVSVRAYSKLQLKAVARQAPSSEFPNSLKLIWSKNSQGSALFQVRLGDGYGFLISDQMLAQHPYLWLREMGFYISRLGTWEETEEQRAEAAAMIKQSLDRPYVSCAEKYFEWTGYVEQGKQCMVPVPTKTGARTGLDDKVWDFFREKETWPVEARAVDHVKKMPEVDATYFTNRFPDLQYFRMYLGWPEHDDRFILWGNGKLEISSSSVGGNPQRFPTEPWLPRASAYTFQFGVGTAPRFRRYGDQRVRQHLKNGYDLVPVTEWSDGGMHLEQTNFAYPLDGEQIKTGIEPLLAWTGLRITNERPYDLDDYVGIQFTDEDRGQSKAVNLGDLCWRNGGFFAGEDLLAATDPALEFEEVPTMKDELEFFESDWSKDSPVSFSHFKRFRARIHLPAFTERTFVFANFYRGIAPSRILDVHKRGYQNALNRTQAFWGSLQSRGASISVPDELMNNLGRTLLPRITICAQLDINGNSIFEVAPLGVGIWPHVVAYAVADYLAPRGYFDLAKRYMEPFFRWQGTQVPDFPAINNWEGFFGVPPEYAGVIWMMHHGVFQWGCARYFWLSGDQAWLEENLPALIKSMDWVKKTRTQTKTLNPDGSRPLNYGWFPAGRVSDVTSGTSINSDAHLWRGLDSLTQVLEAIKHPRAAEFRTESDDYHNCLLEGMRRATTERLLVRLNDDTWVPYLPAYLNTTPGNWQGEPTLWYADVVDDAWQTMFDTRLFPDEAVEYDWLLNYFEDSYSPMVPSCADEPRAFHTADYLRRDMVGNFLYALYSWSTMRVARQTLTTYEHRSMGKDRAFEMTGSAAGFWMRNFLGMLCRRVGDELWLMQATPRRWLKDGAATEVKGLHTEFGPISFSIRSRLSSGSVEARVTPPTRQPAKQLKIRFRGPAGWRLRSVTLNGENWREFDPDGQWVIIPGSLKEMTIQVRD
jgi:hypothetical protein